MATTRFKFAFALIMVIILLVLVGLLWQRFDTEIHQQQKVQNLLMQQQAVQTAKAIDKHIGNYRNQMAAIGLDNLWLSDISQFENLVSVQEKMHDRLKLYFPDMYAFTLASEHGEQLGGDIELTIGQVCQADISRLSAMFQPQVPYFDYEPYIHAQPGSYHFDIMIPVYVHGHKMVFFMSFKADILSRILKEHLISEHQSFLVRKDIPDLIEVTAEKVREDLQREHKLSPSELELISAKVDIPHSRWTVVVKEQPQVLAEFKQAKISDMSILLVILLAFWSAVLWLGLHYQSRQGHLVTRLNHLSQHDSLTGLANRRKINENISVAIENAKNSGVLSALLYMDLNGFKEVNDEHGHNEGDILLIEFAKRLQALSRHEDIVARIGGDEFVVLLNNVGLEPSDAKRALKDALKRFNQKLNGDYHLGDAIDVYCMPSIGGVIIDESVENVDELLKTADKEMYEVKNQHKQR